MATVIGVVQSVQGMAIVVDANGNLTACETQLSGTANLSNGLSNIKLSAPGIGSDGRPNGGSVDVEINTGNVASGEQTCSSTTVTSATSGALPWFGAEPLGKATFGIYKSPVIYLRESF
ncbi:MAG: DUF6701 domain-containing protein [Methylophilus sp.]|uniref:DUF6701 domain-containing protein n=1 Tax=Methylophilus sp. TaxID=29541 RepID=UPI003F9F8FF0